MRPANDPRSDAHRSADRRRPSPRHLDDGRRRIARARTGPRSLEGDLGTLRLELRLRLVGGFLVRVLENCLRRGLDEVLRLLEAQAGELTYDLDDLDLLATVGVEDDVERVLLLLDRRCRGGAAATGRRNGNR